MDFEGRTLMRTRFDTVADDYDRVRPRYPAGVFDDLVELAALPLGARLVEVGCGTGQATIPLAEHGFRIVAVEPGEHLASLARLRLSGFPNVEVVTSTFEDWRPAGATGFDAVVSFAAFHWVDPATRYGTAARLLAPGGALAVFEWQDTLTDDGDPFFVAMLEDYAAVVPEWKLTAASPPDAVEGRDRIKVFVDASGVFAPADLRHYVWQVTYTAHDYVTFLGTQGSFLVLDETRRKRLFDLIEHRIATDHGGSVHKEFLGTLAVSRRA
jgi:SAM-dependent methyltransferase